MKKLWWIVCLSLIFWGNLWGKDKKESVLKETWKAKLEEKILFLNPHLSNEAKILLRETLQKIQDGESLGLQILTERLKKLWSKEAGDLNQILIQSYFVGDIISTIRSEVSERIFKFFEPSKNKNAGLLGDDEEPNYALLSLEELVDLCKHFIDENSSISLVNGYLILKGPYQEHLKLLWLLSQLRRYIPSSLQIRLTLCEVDQKEFLSHFSLGTIGVIHEKEKAGFEKLWKSKGCKILYQKSLSAVNGQKLLFFEGKILSILSHYTLDTTGVLPVLSPEIVNLPLGMSGSIQPLLYWKKKSYWLTLQLKISSLKQLREIDLTKIGKIQAPQMDEYG
ncbi:MAG: hypothetical protein D6785_01460, partial [Planctomycetota bacterium]